VKSTLIRFVIWFVILSTLGMLGYSLSHQLSQILMPMALFCVYVLITLGGWRYNVRVVRYSTNVNQMDRFLRRRKKRPLPGYLYATVRHDYTTARKLACRISNPQQRIKSLVGVAISLMEWNEAEALLAQVEDVDDKNNIRAIMALFQREWAQFYEFKAQVKDELSVLVLEVEEAFARGDMDKADRLGHEVIERSKGLQRYVFSKGLEISRTTPDRDTYF
jgi:hypothetical protein